MDPASLSIYILAQRCSEDTEHYYRQKESDTRHCFELLRRALVEGKADAFTHIYNIYYKQVLRWVYNHPSFRQTNENAEHFVSQAFSNFYFGLRGEKFERFIALAQALAYLRTCAHNAIKQYLRQQPPIILVDIEDVILQGDPTVSEINLEAAALWDRICYLLPNEDDQLLARYVFILGFRPAYISRVKPEKWPTARSVSVALQRIRRKLRGDDQLRNWSGVSPGDSPLD